MLAAFLAFLGLPLGIVTSPPGHLVMQEEAEDTECVTCVGTGFSERSCWFCEGDGKRLCPACTRSLREPPDAGPFRDLIERLMRRPPRTAPDWIPEAVRRQSLERITALVRDVRLPTLKLPKELGPGSSKKSRRPTELGPGELGCPANCVSGEVRQRGEWVDCKLCRSGKFRCGLCKKGELRCNYCKGKRKSLEACDDCAGLGRIPDPSRLPLESCPWCHGAGLRACGTCDEAGTAEGLCDECKGVQRRLCPQCHGIGKFKCKACDGRGHYRFSDEKCEECRQKKVFRCELCKGGVVACTACSTEPVARASCPDCAGKKEHLCNGCHAGAYRAWEYAAEWSRRHEDADRAVAWLAVARSRCERRYADALEDIERREDPAEREPIRLALQRELKEELERLDGLAAAAAKAKKITGSR